MQKEFIDRRLNQMELEGVIFQVSTNVGVDIDINEIKENYDALVLTGGSESPRDLPVPGRELDGVHFAMDFLPQQNRRVSLENLNVSLKIMLFHRKSQFLIQTSRLFTESHNV